MAITLEKLTAFAQKLDADRNALTQQATQAANSLNAYNGAIEAVKVITGWLTDDEVVNPGATVPGLDDVTEEDIRQALEYSDVVDVEPEETVYAS